MTKSFCFSLASIHIFLRVLLSGVLAGSARGAVAPLVKILKGRAMQQMGAKNCTKRCKNGCRNFRSQRKKQVKTWLLDMEESL